MKRVLLLVVLAFCLSTSVSTAQDFDFLVSVTGPHYVFPGVSLYLRVETQAVSGDRQFLFVHTEGLPGNFVVTYPTLDMFCCGGNRMYGPGNYTQVKIVAPSEAEPAAYPVTMRVQNESGSVVKTLPWWVNVITSDSGITPPPPPPDPPEVVLWESNLETYAVQHRDKVLSDPVTYAACCWSGAIWYYDGARVLYQASDYLRDTTYKEAAENILTSSDGTYMGYRDYIIQNNAAVPGYRIFPHGIYRHWLETGTPEDKSALESMVTNAPYRNLKYGIPPKLSREITYQLAAYIYGEKVNPELVPHERLTLDEGKRRAVSFLIGHLDQWFISKNNIQADSQGDLTEGYFQPFMVALLAEVLIEYYETVEQDPRIPFYLEAALQEMWDMAWDDEKKGFFYESSYPDNMAYPLNLLIAPVYAWLYHNAGEQHWADKSDELVSSGLDPNNDTWLAQGKQFSQNFRWSFKWIEWRHGRTEKK